ncbi:kinase-like domain-containing protein [Rhizophagus clarus]|uniref:Kinase-like domain-containing protein n=1 Tax=Rhizophagus clarus TaxID=94130 RepID=A0A8H3R209_9GLOM|nr:kinase-like domain-containing protein [Rhizophagus clarus]
MPENLWKRVFPDMHQRYAIIKSTTEPEDRDERIIYIEDLEKRRRVYGICGECDEPGTGENWCQPCNAKRFKDNFKNWTSGNKDIDELIQQSQLNAVHFKRCLEWIPFERFQNITYIAKGGFGKIYSAEWPEGIIEYWDIKKEEWHRNKNSKDFIVALKSLDNSSDISSEFINEIKSHLQIFLYDVVQCFGITQDSNTNEGLLDIHNAGKVHKDFHSEGIFGVLPYVAPEVLRGYNYTKAADIYSFGIIMNEFLSEETPYYNIPQNAFLAMKICEGQRPTISEDIPKLLANLIIKCWDAKIENRPITKELYQILKKWDEEKKNDNTEIYFQIKESDKIRKKKFENKSRNIQINLQTTYSSRLLNFKNLPIPVNSLDLSSSFQLNSDNDYSIQSSLSIPISECLNIQLNDESELNEIY